MASTLTASRWSLYGINELGRRLRLPRPWKRRPPARGADLADGLATLSKHLWWTYTHPAIHYRGDRAEEARTALLPERITLLDPL